MRFIYLHGFASSPRSAKAVFFGERLARLGHAVDVLDLEEGDFEGLTITRQLGVVRRAIARTPGELALIGSSMGGYLALVAAAEEPRVQKLMLMAPAVEMRAQWAVRYGAEKLASWKAAGVAPTFHHAYGEQRFIGYGLYEDLGRYDPAPPACIPTLAFMGRRDDTVAPAAVERWAAQHAMVRLRWLDSGHDLIDQLETMWSETAAFFGFAVLAVFALFGCGGRSARSEPSSNAGTTARAGASAGTSGSGGSTDMASGGSSGDDLRCTNDADCSQCLYARLPTNTAQCANSLGCCGGQLMNEKTCAKNQAAFESVCAGQNVSPPICPCEIPGVNCVVGCTDGECAFQCSPPANAGGSPAR